MSGGDDEEGKAVMRIYFPFLIFSVMAMACCFGCQSSQVGPTDSSSTNAQIETKDAKTATLLRNQNIPDVNFRDAGSADVAGFVADSVNGVGFPCEITQEVFTNTVSYKIKLHSESDLDGVTTYVQPIVQKLLPFEPIYSLQAKDISTFTLLEEINNLFGWKVKINNMEIILTTPNVSELPSRPIKGAAIIYRSQF
jgi:hypothetical protein